MLVLDLVDNFYNDWVQFTLRLTVIFLKYILIYKRIKQSTLRVTAIKTLYETPRERVNGKNKHYEIEYIIFLKIWT